jgi:uncharacterized protein YaiL (DUF2058 family)
MGKSLQDQLLALGLASEKSKPAKPRRKSGKPRPTQRKPKEQAGGEMPLDKAYALRKQEEGRQADKARRKKQEEDLKRRKINNDIRKIVEQYRLNDDKAEIPRNFMFRGRIRKIYVTAEQQRALNEGQMGISYLSGGYHILARENLEAVRSISPDHIPDLGGAGDEEEDHPVPADLSW